MNLYIWNRLDGVTCNYHNEAGVVVIARSQIAAKRRLQRRIDDGNDSYYTPPLAGKLAEDLPDADEIVQLRVDSPKVQRERIWVFPDAGCC